MNSQPYQNNNNNYNYGYQAQVAQPNQPIVITGLPAKQSAVEPEVKPTGYAQPVVMPYYNYDGTGAVYQQPPSYGANYGAY